MRPTQFWIFALLAGLLPGPALAQIRVNPTGVNVNSQGATSVYLSYGGLASDYVPAEAFWCGDVVDATPPALGFECVPTTLYGAPAAAYDHSQLLSGGNAFVDIMSIPPSIARRAYQDAERGLASPFFYVRRFVSTTGGPDVYVSVTCRPTGGGARVPLALTSVRYHWDGDAPVLRIASGETLPAFRTVIQYNGAGRLAGRWEIVRPGEELPSETDLLPEASLPPEQRASQRRYTSVGRFNVFVPPGDSLELPGPDLVSFPLLAEGTYRLLLRIEASEEKEGDADLSASGAGTGVVHSGAVAGFALPVIRFVVGGDPGSDDSGRAESEAGAGESKGTGAALPPEPIEPEDGAVVATGQSVELVWSATEDARFYRVEVEASDGRAVASAILPSDRRRWKATPWVRERLSALGIQPVANESAVELRWRAVALGGDGSRPRPGPWRKLRLAL